VSKAVRVLVLVVAVAAVVARFLIRSPMWLDEALTVNIAKGSISQIVDHLHRDGHPPLYYVLLHGWMNVFGEGDRAVRALSGLISLGCLPLIWAAGRRVGGRRVAECSVIALALSVAYRNLPEVGNLSDYRPKLPLRVYTAEGQLIGEFGEERRTLIPIGQIPKVMKDAVLAIEDARFYEHNGIDYVGVMRAALANLGREKSQGASTITMQVARNVYLTSEKTYTRKIYEMLLTLKLEHQLSKDQILEIYMNQIFLGNRAYGFAAAAETYFGKPLKDVTIAEAAMLAGIPKFPSTANPIANFARAKERQLHIIDRMVENGFITADQAAQAKAQELHIRPSNNRDRVHAEYVAEMVRRMMFEQYGEQTYSRGLKVYTTLKADDQQAAYHALRRGIMDYERRQAYRGPEKFVDLPKSAVEREAFIGDVLADYPDFRQYAPEGRFAHYVIMATALGGAEVYE